MTRPAAPSAAAHVTSSPLHGWSLSRIPIVPPERSREPIQRKITIDRTTYTHGSKKVNTLFDDVVAPWLEKDGYKTYGVKSQLVTYIRNNDITFKSNSEFLQLFGAWLQKRTRKVKGGETTPVLKEFSVSKMSRPAWPADYTSKLGAEAGDNIRHVVRNATLKRALALEHQRLQTAVLEVRKRYFALMGELLGISISPKATLDKILPAIYKKLYLHIENLFAGDGPINQIIGFAADGLKKLGDELLSGGENLVDISKTEMRVMQHIYSKAASVKADTTYKQYILSEVIGDTVRQAFLSIYNANEKNMKVSSEVLGDLVADIGLNFGFDLIDGRRVEDQEGIGQRQQQLLEVEVELQRFISREGRGMSLINILSKFLGQKVAYQPKVLEKKDAETVEILLRTNNCLINAIARPTLGRNANLAELVTIRAIMIDRGFELGEMLVASPAILNIIRGVFNTSRGVIVHYQGSDQPSDTVAGPSPIVIDHQNQHFQERRIVRAKRRL